MSKRILKFNELFERVQDEWFEENPEHYLSSNKEEINMEEEKEKEKENSLKEKENIIKKTNIDDITFVVDDKRVNILIKDLDLKRHGLYKDSSKEYLFSGLNTDQDYKLLMAFIKTYKLNTVSFRGIHKSVINKLFNELDGYYGVFYKGDYGTTLFLTKSKLMFSRKIKELKKSNTKIIYYNNKVKGKEMNDIEDLSNTKLRNVLKKVSIDDIKFDKVDDYTHNVYVENDDIINILGHRFNTTLSFDKEEDDYKTYFGRLKNRYHLRGWLDHFKGIGLGYKIYKAFVISSGYIVSDEQTTLAARNMYYKLAKDDDFYIILDTNTDDSGDEWGEDSDKIMVIHKEYDKMDKLLRIVREHEKGSGRHYRYDTALKNK